MSFRRVVVTGVENSGKTSLSQALAAHLGWPCAEEQARNHPDVLEKSIDASTFDALHETQTAVAAQHEAAGAPGVICDTGDLVLRLWSESILGFSWHPLAPPQPRVDLYILCPTLATWEPDPLRSLPRLEDRLALEAQYREHLTHRHHLVAEGDTVEDRLQHILSHWPW